MCPRTRNRGREFRKIVQLFFFFCVGTICVLSTETEQNNENLSFYFGVIDKLMQYSDSEQPVPRF